MNSDQVVIVRTHCHVGLQWLEIEHLFSITVSVVFFLNNQTDALIIQIYSVIKLYMFQASSLPIIRSFPLYIQHW